MSEKEGKSGAGLKILQRHVSDEEVPLSVHLKPDEINGYAIYYDGELQAITKDRWYSGLGYTIEW